MLRFTNLLVFLNLTLLQIQNDWYDLDIFTNLCQLSNHSEKNTIQGFNYIMFFLIYICMYRKLEKYIYNVGNWRKKDPQFNVVNPRVLPVYDLNS